MNIQIQRVVDTEAMFKTGNHFQEISVYGDVVSIDGAIASFSIDTDRTLDADIGGRDGVVVTGCELMAADLQGVFVGRDWVLSVIGKEALERIEDAVAEAYEESL